MSKKDPNIERLCATIEAATERKMRTPKDFEFLATCIFERLHQKVSPTTLKRLWGYLAEPVMTRRSTLDLLAQFVGADNWEDFCLQAPSQETTHEPSQEPSPKTVQETICPTTQEPQPQPIAPQQLPPPRLKNRWWLWTVSALAAVLAGLLLWLLGRGHSDTDTAPIPFADPAVKAICVAHWDADGDGELSIREAAQVAQLEGAFTHADSITSFNEFQHFTGLSTIDDGAFQGCKSLTAIIIPTSVKTIGAGAFSFCESLKSIEIPDSVQSCGRGTFYQCHSLFSIRIGKGVRDIGGSFAGSCPLLQRIEVAAENPVYDSRNGCNAIMETATNRLIMGCKSTIVPDETTALGFGAFEGCYNLERIRIPEGVTSIGTLAFNYCYNLTAIELPSTLTTIEHEAFAHCAFQSVVSHAPTPPTLSDKAFSEIPRSCTLTVPQGTRSAYLAAGWNEQMFGGGVAEK